MSLIDHTYFIRDINVPILAENNTDSHYVRLVNSIQRYENDVLKALLGYSLWKEFSDAYAASQLEVTDEDYAALPTKWDSLVNGAEFSFEYNGQTISTKWNGLLNSDKVSLIAYYVYYQHRFYGQTSYTGIGETKPKGENSVVADENYKLISAWNSMVELYGKIPYPTVRYKSVFNNADNYVHYDDSPSAYNFLLANVSDYSGWVFTPLRKKHNYF